MSGKKHVCNKIEASGTYLPKKFNVGSSLELFGWRLDSFYEISVEDKIEFENKSDSAAKRKPSFIAMGNPGSPCRFWMLPRQKQFDGVTVKGSLPELFHGMDFAYFIQDDRFCKAEPDFMEKASPCQHFPAMDSFIPDGRNTLSNFYHNVLPQLQDIADITEENPEKFRQYLTPEAHFVFYLDMEDDNITCKISSFTVKKSIPYARLFRQQHSHGATVP